MEQSYEEYKTAMRDVSEYYFEKFWDYKASLLKTAASPQDFFYLYFLPINQTAQFVIKKFLGE